MQHLAPFAVVIAFFLFLAVAAVAGIVADYKKRGLAIEPLRAAIERGQPLDPQLVERLMAPESRDERLNPLYLKVGGIITIASGVGERRLARDPALADDLAQQVLLQAWRSLPRLKSVTAFGAWLRRLAVNAWLADLRATPPPAVSIEAEELASAAVVVPRACEELDLDRALARLAPDVRLCVVLAYSEGMSHGEISAATGLPLGTVKSHVRRGAERLRASLHGYQASGDHAHV